MERLLKSRYKIKDKIGESPFCVTYLGTYLEKDKPLVIKIYKRSVLSSHLIKSIKQKVKILCNLKHENIAKVIDGDYGWQGFYFVREYVEGKNLNDLINSEPKIDIERSLKIIDKICEAVSMAQNQGIIHGALYPNNVIVSKNGDIKITDFILMGEMRGALKERAQMAFTTSMYLTPEELTGQFSGNESDVYSIAQLHYILLSGKHPFNGKSGLDTSLRILRDMPENISSLRGDAPGYLDQILLKAMQKDPLERFRTVEKMHNSLKAKTLIEEKKSQDEFSDISLDSLINSIDEEKIEVPVITTTETKESKSNIFLVLFIIILAALLGIGYAAFNFFLNK